ncbi:MAG: 2-C-methyl-D-erythritol 4-phosphate cytidylyltransferase [Candidatus Cloacimonetes bacterium]|nr:2-C-methyl-D-erythritol 4-phosphate cytidylyltransferase [Candidatus Cloacimonadota bacterium]
MSDRNIAIITAGGIGKRLIGQTKKQFIKIKGRPLLFWTVDKFVFHEEIDEIIITLPQDEIDVYSKLIMEEYPQKKIKLIPCGNLRQDSVYNALLACPENTLYVLIHDAVRPFVTKKEISQLLVLVKEKQVVIPISKIKNTVKQIENGRIVNTEPRENLASALTPQVFSYELIMECHRKAKNEKLYFTDDAAILEHFGYDVWVLECGEHNFKITDSYDMKIAKHIIENDILSEDNS